jgi:hypothetical protein
MKNVSYIIYIFIICPPCCFIMHHFRTSVSGIRVTATLQVSQIHHVFTYCSELKSTSWGGLQWYNVHTVVCENQGRALKFAVGDIHLNSTVTSQVTFFIKNESKVLRTCSYCDSARFHHYFPESPIIDMWNLTWGKF